jgi:hypothetical protein
MQSFMELTLLLKVMMCCLTDSHPGRGYSYCLSFSHRVVYNGKKLVQLDSEHIHLNQLYDCKHWQDVISDHGCNTRTRSPALIFPQMNIRWIRDSWAVYCCHMADIHQPLAIKRCPWKSHVTSSTTASQGLSWSPPPQQHLTSWAWYCHRQTP